MTPHTVSRLGLALLATALAACTTNYGTLAYKPLTAPLAPAAQTPVVSVGEFQDARGTDANWLGAIRGGYGNPLKTLRCREPVSKVVAEDFAQALRSRGVLAEPGQGKLVLSGTIQKLDTSQYFNIEAHAHLAVRLTERESGREAFSTSVRVDEKEGGWGPGILGNTENLRSLLERTLSNAIDQILANPELRAALQMQGSDE